MQDAEKLKLLAAIDALDTELLEGFSTDRIDQLERYGFLGDDASRLIGDLQDLKYVETVHRSSEAGPLGIRLTKSGRLKLYAGTSRVPDKLADANIKPTTDGPDRNGSSGPKRRSRPPAFSSLATGRTNGRQRLSIEIGKDAIENMDRLRQMHGEQTNSQIIRLALAGHREALEASMAQPGKEAAFRRDEQTLVAFSLHSNRAEIIRHAQILIIALQEALDFDPVRHHNSGPPPLWLHDRKYLSDIKALTEELQRLNDLLESSTVGTGMSGVAREAGKQMKVFLANYVPLLGKGTAVLTLLVMKTLLAKMGISTADVETLLAAALKGP